MLVLLFCLSSTAELIFSPIIKIFIIVLYLLLTNKNKDTH